MNTQNAILKIRNRTVEIKWTTQYANHILDNYINNNTSHDLNFLQISKMLKTAKIEHQNKDIFTAKGTSNGVKYLAIIQLVPNFAIVKTCYRYGWNIK